MFESQNIIILIYNCCRYGVDSTNIYIRNDYKYNDSYIYLLMIFEFPTTYYYY